MSKLPINFLLYTTALGLAGASAWQFWEILKERDARTPNDRLRQTFVDHMKKGRGLGLDDRRDRYARSDGQPQEWWRYFERSNYTGKLPPPPPPDPSEIEQPTEVTETTRTPVSDILEVVLLIYDGGDKAKSKVVVRYKPESNVQVPARLLASASAGPGDVTAVDSGRGGAPAMPAAGGDPNEKPRHHLRIGDKLWPPHDNITLAGIDIDSALAGALFRREGDPEDAKPEKVYTDELQLGQDVLAELDKDPRIGRKGAAARRGGAAKKAGGAGARPAKSAWTDVRQTREKDGAIHISRKDDQFLRDNAQRIFNEDVGFRSYTSRSGRRRGVQITRISPKLSRFGAQTGDVILSVNNNAVRTKAQAIKVGKDLYKRGVRTFYVDVLRRGRVETVTYHAPEK